MKNTLLLLSVLMSSLFYSEDMFSANSSNSTIWRPVDRSAIIPSTILDGRVLRFHFNIPTENSTIQIYDQSGQLIFEDSFSTLSSPDYQISLADFSAGSYTVYYSDGESSMSGLLILD